VVQKLFQNALLEKFELRLIAEETRFVDREILEEKRQLLLAFPAGQQAVIAIEGIELARFQAALEAVLQKVGTALVKIHAAFLIDEGLQEFQFRFG